MPDRDTSIPVGTEKMVKKQQERMKKGQQFMKIEGKASSLEFWFLYVGVVV